MHSIFRLTCHFSKTDSDDDVMELEGEGEDGEMTEEPEETKKVTLTDQRINEERSNMLVAHFLFSLVWSVGGCLDGNSRLKFDEFFRSLCDMEAANSKYPR